MADETVSPEEYLVPQHEAPSSPSTRLDLQPPPGTMSLYDGFALLVSLQVGAGIFSSPSQVDNHTPSPGIALITWTVSGLIAWAGAASFAELGAAIPVNGGMQEYLHDIYGDFLAFLASWIWILAVKPPSMALLSIIFAEYWTNAILPHASNVYWLNKLLALGALGVIVFFNAISMKTTSRLANIFLYLKLTTVVLLIICCILVVGLGLNIGIGEPNSDWKLRNWFSTPQPVENKSTIDWNSAGGWELLGQYTTALYAGLWAYGGWDNVSYI
jgi:L-type amino acid transporter 9